jgi:polyhydroxyalkanoate synthase
MSQPLPDAAGWLSELMKTEHFVLWPAGDVAEMSRAAAAAAAPWTQAVAQLTSSQLESMGQFAALWSAALSSASGTGVGAAVAAESIGDERFAGAAWTKDPRYAAVARTYLAQTELMRKALDAAALDERSKGQWGFLLRQVADALSPTNLLATNPEALQLALETGGASLVQGLQLFLKDLAQGRISITDESAFTVGDNLAVTRGSVIYQNDVIQLIQYRPTTAEVYERPLVIVPPCINKYYILDLQPANSFVVHAIAQGHTVFMISWRNAGPGQAELTWDDYLAHGVLKAIDIARTVTGADAANTLGFCIGGTLLASALAVCAARGAQPAASLTLLTTMLDFGDTGEIGLLVSEQAVAAREAAIGRGGLLKGRELAQVFASLRANDLIWRYSVQGYLKGQAPPAFDLLYWNSDDSNLPGPMFCWYLRNTYLENKLRRPGGTTQLGVPVDLGAVAVPAFVFASREDHIVPWKTAYTSTQLLGGETTFVLGASGHIAGVVNPPARNKRNYWAQPATPDGGGGATRPDPDADRWLDAAERIPGSWWPAWATWLARRSGRHVAAPERLGDAEHPPLEDAPGSYVSEKAV